MSSDSRELLGRGAKYGLLVGLFFAIMEMIGAAAMGAPAFSPWRAFASTILGQRALTQTPFGIAFIVGVVAHFALSAIYGVAYAYIIGRASATTRASLGREAAIGLLFGVALYLVNFQVIARVIYPWFRHANQPWQFILHTVFFGLPLALLFGASERRMVRRLVGPARTT
jgi:hypothetical protein